MSTDHPSAVTPGAATVGRVPELLVARQRVLAVEIIEAPLPRVADAAEQASLIRELQSLRKATVERLLKKAAHTTSVTDGIVAILKEASIQTGPTGFADAATMEPVRSTIERLVLGGRPLPLGLLLGGAKAPNLLKVGHRYLPDLAEWVAYTLLGAIAEAIAAVYPPGGVVLALPDAGLHTADLAFAADEVQAHVRALQFDLFRLGLADLVIVPDTLAFLPARWPEEVRRRSNAARARALHDMPFAADVRSQAEALRFLVNTRDVPLSLEEWVGIFAAPAAGDVRPGTRLAREVTFLEQRAQQAAFHYVGVNHAIRSLDLVGHMAQVLFGSADHVRLSVHAKPAEPRPALIPASRWARMALLPMHGLGLLAESHGERRYDDLLDGGPQLGVGRPGSGRGRLDLIQLDPLLAHQAHPADALEPAAGAVPAGGRVDFQLEASGSESDATEQGARAVPRFLEPYEGVGVVRIGFHVGPGAQGGEHSVAVGELERRLPRFEALPVRVLQPRNSGPLPADL